VTTPKTSPARTSRLALPQRITTPRLVLRPWRRTDAPLLKNAIDANLEHLRAWMSWAKKEPSTLPMIERRIDKFDRLFRAESEWGYGIFSEGEKMLYGGAGLHRSTTKGALEIGFWLQQAWTKHGYATEAVKAVADVAMGLPNIDRVQIRCDTRNTTSASVAQRAGFRHVETLKNDVFEPGAAPRDTMVWELSRPAAMGEAPVRRGFFGWLKSLFA